MSDLLPPHDDAAEAGALACLLLDEPGARTLLDQLHLEDFYDLRHREIYRALLAVANGRGPINPVSLFQHLRDQKLLDQVGGFDYVASLPERAPSAAQFPVYHETLRDRAARRALLQEAHHDIQTALDTSRPIDLPSPDAELDRRIFDPGKPPPPLRAIYQLARKPICTPGNLSTITASIKAGKSGFIGALIAAPMAGVESDCLGLFSRNDQARAILHFDTEQSTDDHWHLVDTALKRAGVEHMPPWLFSYCLTGMNADETWSAVRAAIRKATDQCGGIHAILIDGVADLVQDVNDATRSNALVSRLHKLALAHDCPIICVIHFNPGTDKSRGHLGSQLERKAETNLRLEKTNEITEIYSEKQRRAPIHKGEGICFRSTTPSNATSRS